MSKGLLIVFSGPSGVGKGTVLKKVFEKDSNLVYSVSCTTRQPRENETDGVHYHFITHEQFEQNIKNGVMLEYASYCNNYYGTSAEYVNRLREEGRDVVLEIEVQGAMQIKDKCPDAVMIFIAPPSFEELQRRLIGRATETEEVIAARIARAKDELAYIPKYTYPICNDNVDDTCDKVLSVLKAERIKNNKINII